MINAGAPPGLEDSDRPIVGEEDAPWPDEATSSSTTGPWGGFREKGVYMKILEWPLLGLGERKELREHQQLTTVTQVGARPFELMSAADGRRFMCYEAPPTPDASQLPDEAHFAPKDKLQHQGATTRRRLSETSPSPPQLSHSPQSASFMCTPLCTSTPSPYPSLSCSELQIR